MAAGYTGTPTDNAAPDQGVIDATDRSVFGPHDNELSARECTSDFVRVVEQAADASAERADRRSVGTSDESNGSMERLAECERGVNR